MISAAFCFALSQICSVALQWPSKSDPKKDWVYLGKEVRVVQFEVNTDFPADKRGFSLNHKSGYIVLKEREFWVSVADMSGASFAHYENGTLEWTRESLLERLSEAKKKETLKLDYLPALTASLNESVDHDFGELFRELISKAPRPSLSSYIVDEKPFGLSRTCEFIGSWRALQRVTFKDGTGRRTICEFKIVLPNS